MASEVDICNLGLSHFGQDAGIAAIDPPDGSEEAEHAARFYPIARDEMLGGAHVFSFARKRSTLAQLVNTRADWAYRYALPADCLVPRFILPDGYSDDGDAVPFEREDDSIYTDAESAVLAYTYRLTDPTKFSPAFVVALSWRVGGYMAGPIVKDPTGRTQAALLQRADVELGRAAAADANTSRTRVTYAPTASRVR